MMYTNKILGNVHFTKIINEEKRLLFVCTLKKKCSASRQHSQGRGCSVSS